MARIGLGLLFAGLPALPSAARAEAETWTSRTGASVQAAFQELKADGTVILRTVQGEDVQIHIDMLSDSSQARARELARGRVRQDRPPADLRQAAEERRSIQPEAFRDAEETVLVHHETRNFDLVIYTPSGRANLFIKEGGKFLSPPVEIQLQVLYHDEEARNRLARRALVSLENEPRFANNTAHFIMNMEDGVTAEVHYEIQPQGVDVGYRIEDPAGIRYPSETSRLRIFMPTLFHQDSEAGQPVFRTVRNPAGMDRAAFLKHIEGYEWRSGTGPRAERVYPFHETVRGIGRAGAWFEIGGGVFGPHTLRVERPRRGAGDDRLTGWIYPDNYPAQGFSMFFTKNNHATAADRRAEKLSITVR